MAMLRTKKRLFGNLALAAMVLSLVVLIAASSGPVTIRSAEARPDATTITLSPSPATIAGCDTITVSVMVNDVAGLYGADVRLAFDPNSLQVVDADGSQSGIQLTPGGFLTGSLFTVYNIADNSLGTIRYAATQLSPTPAITGTGPLLKIMFRAKASGTSNVTFTFTQLADRNGQTIGATAINGSATSTGPTEPAVTISKVNATDARLSWNATTGIADYRIYRGTTPYFTPTDPPRAITNSLTYTDTNVLGDTTTNYYYVVKSACANGLQSANSNRVGELDFAITRNAYNTIALPLIDSSLTTADQLGFAIGAQEVSRWVADVQGLDTRTVGFLGTNFALVTGQGYFVNTPGSGPTVFTVVGGVPAPAAVSFSISRGTSTCLLNLLSLPLDQSSLSNADTLANSIRGVPEISEWKAATNGFDIRTVGFLGTNFSTRIGYPYWPCANTSSGGPVWP